MLDTNDKSGRLVTIFGGSGFIGRHVVRALAKRGYRVLVEVRRPDLANFIQPLGNVGQIHAVQANLRYPDSVSRAVQGSDAVVNLVGILAEKGRQRFYTVQANGAKAIADAAAREDAEPLAPAQRQQAVDGEAVVLGALDQREGLFDVRREVAVLVVSCAFGSVDHKVLP